MRRIPREPGAYLLGESDYVALPRDKLTEKTESMTGRKGWLHRFYVSGDPLVIVSSRPRIIDAVRNFPCNVIKVEENGLIGFAQVYWAGDPPENFRRTYAQYSAAQMSSRTSTRLTEAPKLEWLDGSLANGHYAYVCFRQILPPHSVAWKQVEIPLENEIYLFEIRT